MPARSGRWILAASLVALLLAGVLLLHPWLSAERPPLVDGPPLVTEVGHAHQRVSARPLEVPGDLARVREWFTGRVAFPLELAFGGDADFTLRGVAVERVLDRGAAAVVFEHRAHALTLIVLRPDGLSWPREKSALVTRASGLTMRVWRARHLGYALVSDLDDATVARLAQRLGG